MTRRTSLVACLCALASFDAFADPFAQAFAAFFLGIGAGFLACIVVELAAGPGGWLRRAAVGVFFAIADVVTYLVFINILITVSIAGPSTSASGPGPIILVALAAWVIPALRLAWLLHKRRPTNK